MNQTIGILLVNLGTPDSTAVSDVRKYLREFLMDKWVIDVPFIKRWMLVNLIIAPFRAPKSAVEYKKLWQKRGSPLKFYGEDVRHLLQTALGDDYKVALGMRYQNPSIQSALDELVKANVNRIVVIPLFPQYASASTGSVIEKVKEIMQEWQTPPTVTFVKNFVEDELFIEAWVDISRKYLEDEFDYFVFSYHGLPERQILKGSADGYCHFGECCDSYNDSNRYCYRAQCFRMTKLLTEKLGIPEGKYVTTFQSRLGKNPWIKPFTDKVLIELAGKGIKKVLAFSPAFIADCLETTVEVGQTFKEEFIAAGGEKWVLVESLNTHPKWIECLENMAIAYSS